jgi:glyoxylase-like metal-dependent hydrolase (beta-lactamase superfamily II)
LKNLIRNLFISFVALLGITCPALAGPLEVQKVTDGVWAIVGPFEQRNAENLGNNATFGLVETSEGAVLIDPGGSALGAAMIDAEIQKITGQPVVYVIDTGGQDHRWIGNSYWRKKGAKIIASKDAVIDQQSRGSMQMTMLSQLVGTEGMAGSEPVTADITFDDAYALELGGVTFDIRHTGAAHTPGDSFVWLPNSKTVFAGDIVFVGRMLGVLDFSSTSEWLHAFDSIADLNPEHLVPGHGPSTTLAVARADTYDYIVNLRNQMQAYIGNGGDIIGSVDVDQSKFDYLELYDGLAKRNAQTVFEHMEWE